MSGQAPTLEQRVQRLEDTERIRTLKSTYHLLVNDTRFAEVAQLFTEDAYVKLGYLMPGGRPVVGREEIARSFEAMETSSSQSQVKQFLHTHIVEVDEDQTASGSGMLLACYGVKEQSYVVAGKYEEEYRRVDGDWLFERMTLALYFTVPLQTGWAGHNRHYLVNSGESVPEYDDLLPNPAVG